MLTGKKILVTGAMGLSGLNAVRLYLRLGAEVFLSDKKEGEALPSDLLLFESTLKDLRPQDGPELLEKIRPDFVITAPGVPLSLPVFNEARKKNIPVYGENDYGFFIIEKLWKTKPFVIGVTGTDGKSTTVDIIAHILNSVKGIGAVPCGNYGRPLSDIVFDPVKESQIPVLVTELSSFQLEPLTFFHPDVAMILNVAEDHMDRYVNLEEYLKAKLKIVTLQSKNDLLIAPPWILEKAFHYEEELRKKEMVRKVSVYPYNESVSTPVFSVKDGSIYFRDQMLLKISEFPLRGIHNIMNLQYALIAFSDTLDRNNLQVDYRSLRETLMSMSSLECRMEDLGVISGIQFINDSKATTVQSIESALRSQGERPVYLLLGGRHKGIDFSVLKNYKKNVHFYPFGEARDIIGKAIDVNSGFITMEQAFHKASEDALKAADSSPVLLLSPGCSSYDAYKSFIDRGRHFRELTTEFRKKYAES
jgi:UDP-N-acetylmuramoylalanine--D-glutamate ligase